MYKIASILVISVFFLACSSKDDPRLLQEVQNNSALYNNLLQSKDIRVIKDDRIFGLVSFTYLFEKGITDNDEQEDERFIVGIYHQEDNPANWSLTLNKKAPKEIKKLDQDSPYLTSIPLVNSWTQYYLVLFEHTKSKKIALLYEDGMLGAHKVDFFKDFVYEKSGDLL